MALLMRLIGLVMLFINFIYCHQDSLPNASKLAVVYLHSREWVIEKVRIRLFCSVAHLYRNIAPSTPITVYILYHEEPTTEVLQVLSQYPDLHFVRIPDEEWKLPAAALKRKSEWTMYHPADYRLMGYWRLTCPYAYVRQLGHKYLLFIDDDSYVLEPLNHDLLHDISSRSLSFAYRQLDTDVQPSIGLAELARYYIISNRITLTQLFDDCEPKNIKGLHTSHLAEGADKGTTGGWNGAVMFGNFVIISIDFWFQPHVQFFLNLCLLTGDVIVHRWNEQLVMGMIRLLFVKPEEEMALGFEYVHNKLIDYCPADVN